MTASIIAVETVRPLADLERDALGAAAALRVRGMGSGDRVLLRADNSVAFVTVLLALLHLDTSLVLVDHRQTSETTRTVARRTMAAWAVVDEGDDPLERGRTLRVDAIAEAARDDWLRPPRLSLDAWRERDDALLTLSSGSTGEPKTVVRSGRAFLGNVDRTLTRMRYRPDDVLLPLLPFSHQYGLSLALLAWATPCSLVVAPYSRIQQSLRMAGRAGATVVDATPATYSGILDILCRRPEMLGDLSSVRMWCAGGAPLHPGLAERFRSVTGLPLLDGYGSTELGNVALATLDHPAWCGRPLDGVAVRVLDEAGRDVAPGGIGEIWVRSPDALRGWLDGEGRLVPSQDAWYATSDLGLLDAGGNLRVLGRKYAVHRQGHTLYPEILERKAEACGATVKVVAVDDPRRGCRLLFLVEDPEGGEPRVWKERISKLLAKYEQPNEVVVLDRLPLTATGKVDGRAVARLAASGAGRPGAAVPALSPSGTAVPFAERERAIRDVLALLEDDPGPVVEILTEIAVHHAVMYELQATRDALAGALDEMRRYRPGRVSRAAVFMSSNILLYSYALYLLIPSLFVERTVFRPSSQVHSQTSRLHELLAEVHRLPLELSPASQRQFLRGPCRAADLVLFTGAYRNAEEVRAQLRDDQLFLFFGQGINPFVVGPDADLDAAVEDAVTVRMLNSGQDCLGPDVYFVHEDALERFLELMIKRLENLTYGEYQNPEADYGPLFYDTALDTAVTYLRDHRAAVVHGGRIDLVAGHVEPTVLLRGFDEPLRLVELFSPVFNVVRYHDTERLRQRLTSGAFTERALGATVFGDEPALVQALAQRHTVTVNVSLFEVEDGNRPFGGYGIQANYVSLNGRLRAEPLLISKAVAEHLTSGS